MTTDQDRLSSPADEFHLACLLLSPTGSVYLEQTLTDVDPDDFGDPTLGWMWAAARVIHGRGERVTKRALMAYREAIAPKYRPGQPQPPGASAGTACPLNAPTEPGFRSRLDQVSGEPVYISRLPASVRAVVDTAKLRRLVEVLEQAKSVAVTATDYSCAYETTWRLLSTVEEGDLPAEVVPFADLVDVFHKSQAGGVVVGQVVPTPWPEINEIMSGGFHPGRSFVVAGRPNEGKSLVGLNCAQSAAENGFRTLVVSAEMNGLEVTERMMASGAGVEYGEITRHAMSAYTYAEVMAYSDSYRDMPLWVLDRPGLTIEHVGAVARNMNRRQGLDVLVIDYVQLLEATDKRVSREQQVAHISRSVTYLARELSCAVVVLAQLNRDNVKTNRRPTIADLRESDALGQDAAGVILLHHQQTEEGRPTGIVTLILGKNRFGRRDDVQLRWRAHQARIGGE